MAPSDELAALEALFKLEFFNVTDHKLLKSTPSVTVPRPYHYERLIAEDAIRVLRLGAGIGNDELRGALVVVPLTAQKRKRYEALSYAWGGNAKPHRIILPEGHLQITQSLYAALLRLRRPEKTRLVWIDALCINQFDDEEKATQIMLMPKIYSLASAVLVWLGEDDGNGKASLQLLEKIASVDFTTLQVRRVTEKWMADHGFPPVHNPAWYCLLAFWQRSWFRRSWVVQEFVMAKQVFMLCGDWEVPWKSLASASEKMLEYTLLDWATLGNVDMEVEKELAFVSSLGLRIMMELKSSNSMSSMIANVARSFISRDESAMQELDEGSWGRITGMKTLVEGAKTAAKTTAMSPSDVSATVEEVLSGAFKYFGADDIPLKSPLVNLLVVLEKTEATVPRDKLFAFLGIASDGDVEELRPSYTETDDEVLIRYGNYFANNNFGMQMIYQAGLVGRDTKSTLPSWVAEYTNSNIARCRTLSYPGQIGLSYKAALDTKPMMHVGAKRNELLISGSRISMVIRILPFPVFEESNSLEAHLRNIDIFLDTCSAIITSRKTPYPNCPAEDPSEILWRTLVGNVGMRPFYAPNEWNQEFAKVRDDIRNGEADVLFPSLNDTAPLLPRVMATLTFYDFAVIGGDEGMIGLVPKGSKLGDEVVIFLGGRMPFIVRHGEDDPRKRRLIGGGYVHGIMNGEALSSPSWKDEEFCLV